MSAAFNFDIHVVFQIESKISTGLFPKISIASSIIAGAVTTHKRQPRSPCKIGTGVRFRASETEMPATSRSPAPLSSYAIPNTLVAST